MVSKYFAAGPSFPLAQPAHVGVDRAGVDVAFIFPDIPQQPVAQVHMTRALHQKHQQLELRGRQFHPAGP